MGRQGGEVQSRVNTTAVTPRSTGRKTSASFSGRSAKHATAGVQVDMQSSSRSFGGTSGSKRNSVRARKGRNRYGVVFATKENMQADPPAPSAPAPSPSPLTPSSTSVTDPGTSEPPRPEADSEPSTPVARKPTTSLPTPPSFRASSPFTPFDPPHVPPLPLVRSRSWSRSRTLVCDCPSPQHLSVVPMCDRRSPSPPPTPFSSLSCLPRHGSRPRPTSPNDPSALKPAPTPRASLSSFLLCAIPPLWSCLYSLSSPGPPTASPHTSPPRQSPSCGVPDATAAEADARLPVLPYSDPDLTNPVVRVSPDDPLPLSPSRSTSPDAAAVFRFVTTGHRPAHIPLRNDSHPPKCPPDPKHSLPHPSPTPSPSPQREASTSSRASQPSPHNPALSATPARQPVTATRIVIEDVSVVSVEVSHVSEAHYGRSPRQGSGARVSRSVSGRDPMVEFVSGAAWVRSCMPVAVEDMTRADLSRSCAEERTRTSVITTTARTPPRAPHATPRRSTRPTSPSLPRATPPPKQNALSEASSSSPADSLKTPSRRHTSPPRSRLWECSAALLPQCHEHEKDQRRTNLATGGDKCRASGRACVGITEPLTACMYRNVEPPVHPAAFVM